MASIHNVGAMLAKKADLIVSGKPDVTDWVVPGPATAALLRSEGLPARRYIGKASARRVLQLRLKGLHDYLLETVWYRHGTPGSAPGEQYTTNKCIACHVYNKHARFHERFRECPNAECPTRTGPRPVWLHRELNSCINQMLAAAAQADLLINGEDGCGRFWDPP